MATGQDLLTIGIKHIGEPYVNVLVPKDNAKWKGPWDCAEFASWVVFQATGRLYGCLNNSSSPSVADAYTGSWTRDAANIGRIVTIAEAIGTVGAFLLRKPPSAGKMGHIGISDGRGGTVEARGKAYGVCRAPAQGRGWDLGVFVPNVIYSAGQLPHVPPTRLFKIGQPPGVNQDVRRIQKRLSEFGINPGPIDGIFGALTATAVAAFQDRFGVVVDGEVGEVTWQLLFS